MRGVSRGAQNRGECCMTGEKEEEEMQFNHTTPNFSPLSPTVGYVITPFIFLILIGGAVAVIMYVRKKLRLDELRHKLIPLYNYDPAEEYEWRDDDVDDYEDDLTEPLYTEGRLSFSSDYGT